MIIIKMFRVNFFAILFKFCYCVVFVDWGTIKNDPIFYDLGLLDISRKVYQELQDEVVSYIDAISDEYKLPLRVSYNSTRGCYISLYAGGGRNKPDLTKEDLPDEFIKVSKFKHTLSFTTEQMVSLSAKTNLNLVYCFFYIVPSIFSFQLKYNGKIRLIETNIKGQCRCCSSQN